MRVTTQELARLLSVSPDSIRRWDRQGQLPGATRLGGETSGTRYWDTEIVEAYLKSRPYSSPTAQQNTRTPDPQQEDHERMITSDENHPDDETSKKVRLNVDIDPARKRQIKMKAVAEGISVQDLIDSILNEHGFDATPPVTQPLSSPQAAQDNGNYRITSESKQLQFHLPGAHRKALNHYATDHDTTVASIMRSLVAEFLATEGLLNTVD